MRDSAIPPSVVKAFSLILITLLLAFVNLVFGELVPKRVAMNNPEKVSFAVARVLLVTSVIAKPFVSLLSATTNGVLRLIGIDPNKQNDEVSEEEIRMMIDVGEESGTIEEDEKEMLHNIFEFDDTAAGEIMTHRTEIEGLDVNASLEDAINLSVKTGHSRIPVFDGGLDNIVGILNIKDLLKFAGTQANDFRITDYLRKVMYIPESARCKDIFDELRKKHLQLAVVVDEYGGTAGIVTMEDILESIVGNIQDEYDHETEDISELSDGEYLLDGMAFLDDIAEELNVSFSDAGDYDTIAGYLTDKLGRLPDADEKATVEKDDWVFTAEEVRDHRIAAVRAKKAEENKA
jgi:putative hemolysin